MAGGDLDDELRAFIAAHFRTIEQLEILLFLRGASDRAWTPDAVFHEVRSSVASVYQRLVELAEAGLVDSQEGPHQTFRYRPKTDELSRAVDRRRLTNCGASL